MASKRKKLANAVIQIALEETMANDGSDQLDPVLEALMRSSEDRTELLGTARIEDYVEKTVPTYSDPLFRAHFRMTRTSFQVFFSS